MKYLDSKSLYYAFLSGANNVIRYRKLLNEINVFPVADSDTGNNLAFTMNSIIKEAEVCKSVKKTLESMAEGALLGARGNSGTIFAQFINGLSQEIKADSSLSITGFATSIERTVPYLYDSIENPVEGTMISVIRDWSLELSDLKDNTDDFLELFNYSLTKAKSSLANTQNQLKILKEAEVVDAGAKGFVKFLEGILNFIKDGEIKNELFNQTEELNIVKQKDNHLEIKYRYCSEALLTGVKVSKDKLKEEIKDLGDSLILAGSKEKFKIHIHTNQPAKLFARLNNFGQIQNDKVDDMYKEYLVTNKRKSDIALVTDSIADLPQELIDQHQIQVINLNLIIEGINYLDKLTIDADNFYSLLEEVEEHPSSSQPSLKSIENLFSFLTDHYQSIIVITVSKELSGTWNVVNKAAAKFEKSKTEITVINSKLNSAAQGLAVLEAAEEIEKGKEHEQVVEKVNDVINRTKIYVSLDTLKYMVRGGRVGQMKGLLAKVLNLKPIASLDDNGAGIVLDKGFSRKGVKKKIKKLVTEIENKEGIKRYSIVHAHALDRAKEFAELFSCELEKEPEYISEISPIVGLNSGLGSVAISLVLK